MLKIKIVGNQKRYQANERSPLFHEIKSIVLKTFGLADVLREALEPISKGIKVAFVYGSIAKQTETETSDIDILLIGNNLTYADFFEKITEVELQLGRKINPIFYSPEEWKKKCSIKHHFVGKIIQDSKIFLIGTEDELKKLG